MIALYNSAVVAADAAVKAIVSLCRAAEKLGNALEIGADGIVNYAKTFRDESEYDNKQSNMRLTAKLEQLDKELNADTK